jgi:hypothetical protein
MPYVNRETQVSDERVMEIIECARKTLEDASYRVPTVEEAREVLITDWTPGEAQEYLDEAPVDDIAQYLINYWVPVLEGQWWKASPDRWVARVGRTT